MTMRAASSVALAALAVLLQSPAVHAQDSPFTMNPGAFANQMAIPAMTERLERSHKTIFGSSVEESLAKSGKQAGAGALVAPSSGRAVMPARLAAHYPSAARDQAERLFNELLAGYGQVEQQYRIPKRDLAGAVASYIYGSYVAYRQVDLPDEYFEAVVRQMRQVLSARSELAQASPAERQESYEQFAILGMFMATTHLALKQTPQPAAAANLRQAAKSHLEAFLKVDVDRIEITRQGLVIR